MPSPPSNHRRAALLGILALGVLLAAVGFQKVWSIDVWWQLRNGQWIVEHLDVPDQQMYSWTNPGTPLREMRWLYCAVLYLCFDRLGDWSLTILQALGVWAAWGITIWPFRRLLHHPLAVAVLALGIVAGLGRWVMRPELATYVGVALSLALLARLREHGRDGTPAPFPWAILVGLVVAQVLWTNLHTLFFFGPILAWCFAAGDGVQRRIDRVRLGVRAAPINVALVAAALGTTLACWVNPYFHHGAMYVVQMYQETRGEHATNQFISEMRSPLAMPLSTWTWDLVAGAILALVAGVLALANARRFDVVRLGILLLGVILFVQLQRNAPMLALMAAWSALGELRARVGEAPPSHSRGVALARWGVLGACLLAAWYIVANRIGPRLNQPRESGLGMVWWTTPMRTTEFLTQHPPAGNLFNTIRDGAYIIWAAPDIPVYIDGRTDAYGPALLREVSELGAANWDEFAQRREIAAAMIPTTGYDDLLAHLAHHPSWAFVFMDHRSVLFYRRVPAHESIIAMASASPPGLMPPRGGLESEGAPRWKRLLGARARAWRSEGYAGAWMALGRPDAARPWVLEGLQVEPDNLSLRAIDALLRLSEGDDPQGWTSLAMLPHARRSGVLREAARALLAAERFDLAPRVLREALALEPDDRDLHVALADALFRGGDANAALPHYLRAQQIGPESPNEWNKIAAIEERRGNFAAAEHAAEASVRLEPRQPAMWNMLGAFRARRGDLAGGIQCFEHALRVDPTFAPAADNLARARSLLQGAPPR